MAVFCLVRLCNWAASHTFAFCTQAEVRGDLGWAMWTAQLGTKRDFGLYTDGHANYGRNLYYFLWEMPLFMVIGAMGGLIGATFIAINVQITRLRQKFIPVRCPHRRLVEVMFVAFVTSSIAFLLCYVSPCRLIPAKSDQQYLNDDSPSVSMGLAMAARGYKRHCRRGALLGCWQSQGEHLQFLDVPNTVNLAC